MKILIFSSLYTPIIEGGAEISTQLLAEALVQLGNEVHICTFANRPNDELINGVYVHRRKQKNIYWSYCRNKQSLLERGIWHLIECYNIFAAASIRRVIEFVEPDIIHTNVFTGFSVIVWKIASGKRIPVVHTLRDYYLMCAKSTFFNNGKSCHNQCLFCKAISIPKKTISRYVTAVVGISHFILNKHIENNYFNYAAIKEVVSNSVHISSLHYQRVKKTFSIGFLGRIHESKGIEYLISCFMMSNHQGYTLRIAGEGGPSYVDELKRKTSKDVTFEGRVNPYDFLSNIDLLVVPSLWEEPFGRIVVEANACGCPVFVSNRGGLPELIDGSNGKVFDISRKNSLVDLLNQFFANKLKFNVDIRKTIDMYSQQNIAKQYEGIYRKLV